VVENVISKGRSHMAVSETLQADGVSTEFAGRVAIVTGGGGGIGLAAAQRLAKGGARVALVGRDKAKVETAARDLADGGAEALPLQGDVSSEGDVQRVVEGVLGSFGRVDYVVANAGLPHFGTVLDTSPKDWHYLIGVNLTSLYFLSRACLPDMISRKDGVIIGVGSDCAIRTCSQSAAYVTAKHGLVGLIRSIAVDYGRSGIRANLVVPGVTETPGFYAWNSVGDRTPCDQRRRAEELSPLGRIGLPEDVGDVIAFLCSSTARYMTGAEVVVDGGMTLTYGVD
jgi:NAD(P)-dependent dehydrogenase (short-subunit alcohol dehydrogenase family)